MISLCCCSTSTACIPQSSRSSTSASPLCRGKLTTLGRRTRSVSYFLTCLIHMIYSCKHVGGSRSRSPASISFLCFNPCCRGYRWTSLRRFQRFQIPPWKWESCQRKSGSWLSGENKWNSWWSSKTSTRTFTCRYTCNYSYGHTYTWPCHSLCCLALAKQVSMGGIERSLSTSWLMFDGVILSDE